MVMSIKSVWDACGVFFFKHSSTIAGIMSRKDFHTGGISAIDSPRVKQKVRQDNPAKENSVRARTKALITDEMSKRKGRHHRSSSYPVRKELPQTGSIQCVEPLDEDLLTEIILGDGNPTIVTENSESSNTTGSTDTSEEMCEDCQDMLTCNDLAQKDVENEKQLIENLILLQGNLDRKEQDLLEQKLISTEETENS